MSLWADFLTNDGRLIHKWKNYFPAYERHFHDFVNKSVMFVEVGCGVGGSLQMWKRYFGPHATIVGIDVLPECKDYEEDQIEVRIGPQQDTAFLQGLLDEFGPPDIVLDDGSHKMSDMAATFEFLYPRLSKNGVYMVEDLHTCYWAEYGGELHKPDTFVETCKALIDELNADHTREAVTPTAFTRSTLSIHFYDCAVVFQKGMHTKKWAPRIGRTDLGKAGTSVGAGLQAPDGAPPEQQPSDAAAMNAHLGEVLAQRDRALAELRNTQTSLSAAETTLANVLSSKSWRITEPVRRLMATFRPSSPGKTTVAKL
jgi:hypothetical protein